MKRISISFSELLRTSPLTMVLQLVRRARQDNLKLHSNITRSRVELQSDELLRSRLSVEISTLLKINKDLFLSKSDLINNVVLLTAKQKKSILDDAHNILSHKIKLFSSDIIQLDKTIQWRQDFFSNRVWPLDFFTDVQVSYRDGSDIKVPWELSRFYHLPILTIAFFVTKDEKIINEIKKQITDWLDQNPTYFGPNWKVPMEAAIRVCNWSWVWIYLRSYIADEPFLKRFLHSLYYHGEFIFYNLEYGHFRANHYLSDIVGLVFLGILFPEIKMSRKWLKFSLHELESQIRYQISNEGVDFEASTSYHRLVTELFLYAGMLCKQHKIKLSETYWNRLRRMIKFVDCELQQNGEIPQFGDNDNGRVFILNTIFHWNVLNHQYLIDIGSILFPEYSLRNKEANLDQSILLLFTKNNINNQKIKIQKKQNSYKKIALYKRSGYLFVHYRDLYFALTFTGNGGKDELGSHGHNDGGSFVMTVKNKNIIIDPGTGKYTGDPSIRNKFRSQLSHNCPTINFKESNKFEKEELFHFREFYRPKLLNYHETPNSMLISIINTAYKKKYGISAIRTFTFQFQKRELVITDSFKKLPKKPTKFHWNFTFAKDIIPIMKGKTLIADHIKFSFQGSLACKIKKGIFSPSYGIIDNTNILQVSGISHDKSEIMYTTEITY